MKQVINYIGINQAIPFKVLDEAVYRYLKNEPLNKAELKTLLKEYVQGNVRLEKGSIHINVLLKKNKDIINKIKEKLTFENYLSLSESDRTCLLICLIALAFPVTYELLNILAVGFKVQNKINRNYIDNKISSRYGSNRGVINAVKALMQMLVEYRVVNRDKIGIYTLKDTKRIINKTISDLMIYADIKLSGSKSILLEDLDFRPWYIYFKPHHNAKISTGLFKKIESRVGQGYLTTLI